MRRPMLLAALALAAATTTVATAATPRGLPHVASGHRPGPDALYAPPPKVVPQLQNRGVWHAPPILISGAQSYRDGEWLYQDFLYDDHGALGTPDPGTPFGPGGFLFSPPAGTFTYPTNKVYGDNAADLVELRIKPLETSTAFRVTVNTLKDPERTAFTIALGDSSASNAWPHGAGVSSPARLFLTVHGRHADLTDAATGKTRTPAPTVTVDRTRRQFDVRLPHAAFDPQSTKVRITVGVGLWDTAMGAYLAPQPGGATADTPGGGSPTGVAIVNVGPRFHEPEPTVRNPAILTLADAAAGSAAEAMWWREFQQAHSLATGDVSPFSATVDFAKLRRKTDDDSGVPKTGSLDRILASRHVFGQGFDPSRVCYDLAAGFSAGAKCIGRFVGQLQPYNLYIPRKPVPHRGYGLTLLLHSLSANYNQYAHSFNQSQLGDRGPGSLVITPAGRGPDGFYAGIAEADTFEVWADVARHYRLDPGWTDVSGYSMGGFGTYRLLARYPDLFARGFSVVGVPGTVNDQLASLRNTPLLAWNAQNDELVQLPDSEAAVRDLTAAGLRFTELLFHTADHLTLATNDEYAPGAQFLGTVRVDRDPVHVTYVVDPTEDSAAARTVGDHAYWTSGLRLARKGQDGTIDARSAATGTSEGRPTGVKTTEGALTGGSHGPMPYTQREQDWGPPTPAPRADRLDLTTKNLKAATIDLRRARLTCGPLIDAQLDAPLALTLTCPAPRIQPSCFTARPRLHLPSVQGRRVTAASVYLGSRRLARATGANVRTVRLGHNPAPRTVRIVLTVTGAPKLTLTELAAATGCSP